MSTWRDGNEPAATVIGPLGWLRVLLKGGALGGVVFGGLFVLLICRAVERPLWGMRRPFTPWITQGVCRMALGIFGIRRRVTGQPMQHRGAGVANHSSWLDIFALNASDRLYFVAKAEVAQWAGIGWLARATGTLFIERRRGDAKNHLAQFDQRLLAGHRLLFFPEGTSTDGMRVLPFKTTLFQAFFSETLHDAMWVQPVSVFYHAPDGADSRFYGWWGDMAFGPHLLAILAAPRQGSVEVTYHHPLDVATYDDRKHLARAAQQVVAGSLVAPKVFSG